MRYYFSDHLVEKKFFLQKIQNFRGLVITEINLSMGLFENSPHSGDRKEKSIYL